MLTCSPESIRISETAAEDADSPPRRVGARGLRLVGGSAPGEEVRHYHYNSDSDGKT